ncbi:MAG TPA: magnesium transporter [Acidobacteriota bacterium]|nr:magnesium transporter [Acidobacteriota bacterium]
MVEEEIDVRTRLVKAITAEDFDAVFSILECDGDASLREDCLSSLDDEQLLAAYRLLTPAVFAELISDIDTAVAADLLERLPVPRAADVLDEMNPDDATDVISYFDPDYATRILIEMSPEEQATVRELLVHPSDTAGGRMTPDFVSIDAGLRADEAIDLLRSVAQETEMLNYVYVTDSDDHLLGVVSMRNLVLSSPDTPMKDIMVTDVISIVAEADQEEAARLISRYNLLALPVVDEEHRILGVITIDDIAEVVKEEATEDFHRSAAVHPLEMSYAQTAIHMLYRKRIGWLLVLVVVGISSASVLQAFESTLEQTLVLAFFIPMLIGSGGNTGSQAATIIVRALATGDIRLNEWLRSIWKETRVGLSLGLTMAVATAIIGWALGGPTIALIVGSTMIFIILVANLTGTMLPLLLTRLGLDPAMASSPLVASIMDTVGLLIYFTIATITLTHLS